MKKILSLVFILFVANSCKTKEIVPIPPTLGIVSASELLINSARLSSEISNLGNQYISDYGFVYSETNAEPILADSKISHGAVTAVNVSSLTFSDLVQGLKPSTNYKVRSYATIASGTIFGAVITFNTSDIIQPAIKTDAVILVFENTAKLRGILESKGTYDVSEYGICWSASNVIPTTADAKSSRINNPNVFPTIFTEDAANLSPNTTYYFRAFVVSNGITSYGNVLTFKTLAIRQPTIETLAAQTITVNSVKVNGVVATQGSYDITEYGICWSQRFTTPTTEHSKSKIIGNISNFPANFVVDIYNLPEGGTFYYRAYVISNGITTYGEVFTYTLQVDGFPRLTTDNSFNISNLSQRLQGTILEKGDFGITEYGMCWGYEDAFTTPNTCQNKGSILGSPTIFPNVFTIDATNLNVGTVYFYRSYLISNGVTTFGTQKYFIISNN